MSWALAELPSAAVCVLQGGRGLWAQLSGNKKEEESVCGPAGGWGDNKIYLLLWINFEELGLSPIWKPEILTVR